MRARTWIIALVIGGVLLPGLSASAQEHRYVGANKCRSCHKKKLLGNQYRVWRRGVHARAFRTLQGEKARRIAQERGLARPPDQSEQCLECHVTAFGVDPSRMSKPLRAEDGIQCESCHGPGSDYARKETMSDLELAVTKGLWKPWDDEKICTRCHNEKSPSWNPSQYTLSDGTRSGFDFEAAKKKIRHPIPEDVKGRYLEIEQERKSHRWEAVDPGELR